MLNEKFFAPLLVVRSIFSVALPWRFVSTAVYRPLAIVRRFFAL